MHIAKLLKYMQTLSRISLILIIINNNITVPVDWA